MRSLFYVVVCCAVVVAGCQNSVNSLENADKTMQPDIVVDKRFITDDFLEDRLKLVRVNKSEGVNGFMKVQVVAINTRVGNLQKLWSSMTDTENYRIDYKFSWLDSEGMEIESVLSRWQQKVIKPGETVYIRGVAPSRDCKDFMINLKEAE